MDCNPGPVFSSQEFGILESPIQGSRWDYRDCRVSDSSVLNPGIKKMGAGLQALDCRFTIISKSHIWKINYFHCILSNDCCNVINRIYKVSKSIKASEDKLMQSCAMAAADLQNIKCHSVT